MKHDWLIAFLWEGNEHGPSTCPICGEQAKSVFRVTSINLYQCPKGHRWTAYNTDWTSDGRWFHRVLEFLIPKK